MNTVFAFFCISIFVILIKNHIKIFRSFILENNHLDFVNKKALR